ncbi:hypothetical protein FACS189476_04780 [Spirochaetia bacterium]|nr:hypothetical protein FACS189476_04780 [Spirochaetia bacterium]
MLLDLYDLCDDEESIRSAKSVEKISNNADVLDKAFHGVLKIPAAVPA